MRFPGISPQGRQTLKAMIGHPQPTLDQVQPQMPPQP